MDKLIVTIISIALTAATLYAGADFLSGYYKTARARSNALKIIAQAVQVDVAAHQAGSLSGNGGSWQTVLVPTYLASWPSGAYPCTMNSSDNNCDESGSPSTSANGFRLFVDNLEACQEIQRIGNRGNITLEGATAFDVYGTGLTVPKNSQVKYKCVELTAPVFGTKSYVFLYRVFLERGS